MIPGLGHFVPVLVCVHRAWIISSCTEVIIFLMLSSTWEAFES